MYINMSTYTCENYVSNISPNAFITSPTTHVQVSQSKRHDLDLAQVGQDATAAGVTSPLELYRADNANLVRENNELHQAIIKMKDSFEENIRGMPVAIGPTSPMLLGNCVELRFGRMVVLPPTCPYCCCC